MSAKPRYLTKSTFKIASECPTKLSYLKKKEYWSTNQDNAFLQALAEGGFQVGELAKIYHPGGIQIDTLDYEEALRRTDEALKQPDVTIYEAAIRYKDSFIRIDVLKKKGKLVDLIEVKAKSHSGSGSDEFWTNKGTISSSWEPYLLDIAYQKWVLSKARPELIITPYLMLADKSAKAGIDGINQKFFLISNPDDPTTRVRVATGTTAESLGPKLLTEIKVEREVDYLLDLVYEDKTFEEYVAFLSEHYRKDQRLKPQLGRDCRDCEYRIPPEKEAEGYKNGFKQCWTEAAGLKPQDFERPFTFDIWKLHFTKKDALIQEGRIFMDQLSPEDLAPKTKKKDAPTEPGLSNPDRQWLQVELARKKTPEARIDVAGLAQAFSEFDYPLHFIDFETTRVAIPFHKGRKPYEQVAFQFSHHVVHADGRIEHKDQYISFERGKFPNYDFVRALKAALETDDGTIFRYADHENTVLREIRAQLCSELAPPADADELCQWIDTVTREKTDTNSYREGARCMVDLKWLVQKFFYHSSTRGSNSLKAVLPAVLSESKYLQEKYRKPIYGAANGIPSLNFKNHAWIDITPEGKVKDPYKTLKPVFQDLELPEDSLYEEDERIAEGGAAMTAYTRMQFTEMPDSEREGVRDALLRYCELDTFAMVLLYEYWKHAIEEAKKEKVA